MHISLSIHTNHCLEKHKKKKKKENRYIFALSRFHVKLHPYVREQEVDEKTKCTDLLEREIEKGENFNGHYFLETETGFCCNSIVEEDV